MSRSAEIMAVVRDLGDASYQMGLLGGQGKDTRDFKTAYNEAFKILQDIADNYEEIENGGK